MSRARSVLERVLVPLDGSELSDRIVTQVRRLLRARDSEVILVSVVRPGDMAFVAEREMPVEKARAHLGTVAAGLGEHGAVVSFEVLVGDPATRIHDYALEVKASLLALSTHGRSGVARWIHGSTAERLVRRAPCPVLLANPLGLAATEEHRFRRILVPLDLSERSSRVVPIVRELALLYGSEVTLLHVIETSSVEPPLQAPAVTAEQSLALLEPYRDQLAGLALRLSTSAGSTAAAILELAEKGDYDLVALATHGRSGIARWAFGSVAEKVARHCRCSLLLVRTAGAGLASVD